MFQVLVWIWYKNGSGSKSDFVGFLARFCVTVKVSQLVKASQLQLMVNSRFTGQQQSTRKTRCTLANSRSRNDTSESR
ncbi:hypothetical protein Hanom_Chr03g00179771 [Helianthus anomalus]